MTITRSATAPTRSARSSTTIGESANKINKIDKVDKIGEGANNIGEIVYKIDKIGEAAKKLSDASYPFLKDIDWLSDLHIKPLPGASFTQSLKAVDKPIVMGNAMTGNLLKAFYEFKDVVKAAQRREARGRPEGSSPHRSMRK